MNPIIVFVDVDSLAPACSGIRCATGNAMGLASAEVAERAECF